MSVVLQIEIPGQLQPPRPHRRRHPARGRDPRPHRPQRRRQEHPAQDPVAHHRPHQRPGQDQGPRRQPAGGRHRLPSRTHRAREHPSQRRHPRHEEGQDRPQAGRDHRPDLCGLDQPRGAFDLTDEWIVMSLQTAPEAIPSVFARQVRNRLGAHLKELRLFGSRARGDARVNSDGAVDRERAAEIADARGCCA